MPRQVCLKSPRKVGSNWVADLLTLNFDVDLNPADVDYKHGPVVPRPYPVIMLVRHPLSRIVTTADWIDTVCRQETHRRRNRGTHECVMWVCHWLRYGHEYLRHDASTPPSDAARLRYEDVLADPEGELRALARRLGLPESGDSWTGKTTRTTQNDRRGDRGESFDASYWMDEEWREEISQREREKVLDRIRKPWWRHVPRRWGYTDVLDDPDTPGPAATRADTEGFTLPEPHTAHGDEAWEA